MMQSFRSGNFGPSNAFKGSSFTIFVDNLPNSVGTPWFRKFFSNFGFVVDSHLPVKKSRRTGNRFGFIRFDKRKEVDLAIENANGIWIGKRSLVVERASYDRGFETPKTVRNFGDSGNGYQKLAYPTEVGDFWKGYQNKSFADALNQKRCDQILEEPGKNFRKTENLFTINVQPTATEWLTRSAVVRLINITAAELVQKAFTDINFKDVLVRHLGGMDMIVTFQSKEDRFLALNNPAVNSWFKSIKPWIGEVAGKSRLVWLKCRGMPLIAWGLQTFKRIGEIWGDFIILDTETMKEETFDVGRMLIATECIERIDEWINITVRGRNHKVKVWEEECEDFFNEKVIRDWVSKHLPGNMTQSKSIESAQKKDGEKEQNLQLESDDVGKYDMEPDNLKNAEVDHLKNDDVEPIENAEVYSKCDDLKNTEMEVNIGAKQDVGEKQSELIAMDEEIIPSNPNMKSVLFNDNAAILEDFSSSLGIDTSAMGNEKTLDSLNSVQSPTRVVFPSDEASTTIIMETQDVGSKAIIAETNENTDVINENNVVAAMDSISSSLERESSAVGSEKVLDSVMVTDEAKTQELGEESDKEAILDPIEDNHVPIQTAVKGLQGKKRRKTINEILGFSKVNTGNSKGRRSKNKCVVLRSAIAAAALSASISSDGINNRNKILLDEARTIWEINKMHGIGYDGDEEEVISKIAEMEAQNKERVDGQL